jgi:hypothetical protein
MNVINRILNAAIIVAVVLLAASLVRLYDPNLFGTQTKGIIGSTISLDGVDFSKSRKTLFVFLQQDCSACETSIPFYQNLGNTFVEPATVRLVALTPYKLSTAQKYLLDNGMRVDEVKRWTPGLFGVRVSPTLILADNKGVVTGAWVGVLSEGGQSEVLSKLKE